METMTVNNIPYRIHRLLGKGKGGYSYLAERDGAFFVLKQIHHEPCAYYTFGDKLASELRDFDRLNALGLPLPRLLDLDTENERILKEYIEGETVLELVKRDCDISDCIRQMQAMCEVLYPAGLNIDYFPTNFVVRAGQIFYIDYECNLYDPKWDFEHWGIRYWSKTPELLQYLQDHPG